MNAEEMAKVIRDFFLNSGKWDVDEDGRLSISEVNFYDFDPEDLAMKLQS